MSPDWKILNQQVGTFNALTSQTDAVTGKVSAIYAGLQAPLSQVLASFGASGGANLTIFADTLIVDVSSWCAPAVSVMARCVDLTPLNGHHTMIPLTMPDQGAIAEFLVGGTVGGALTVSSDQPESLAAPRVIPCGSAGILAPTVWTAAQGLITLNALSPSGGVANLVQSPWAMTSLQASFTAASLLMNTGRQDDASTASDMLKWVVSCIGQYAAFLAPQKQALPGDYTELYNQASALLLTLNLAAGAYFVPVLSGDLYKTQLNSLLRPLQAYEGNLLALATQSDLASAIATVSGGLSAAATDEVAPLQVQLDNIKSNVANLSSALIVLRSLFTLELQQAHSRFHSLQQAITIESINTFLACAMDATMNVISAGFHAVQASSGEDPAAIGDTINDVYDLAKNSRDAILASQAGAGDGVAGLVDTAQALMTMQQDLLRSYELGALLWVQVQNGTATEVLPNELAVASVDPDVAWDNYLIDVEAVMTQVDASSSAAKEAAANYLASIKTLAVYGKAIDSKIVAYAGQMAQAAVVNAQISAAQSISARWTQIQTNAKTQVQQKAALQSMVQWRMNSIKRSIYAAWLYYQASYFYLNLQQPPAMARLNTSMDSTQIESVLDNVSSWVMQALASRSDSGQHTLLPSTGVKISLAFDVAQAGSSAAGTDQALYVPASATQGAQITWAIPFGCSQLAGVLPNQGNVPIWITEASFFVEGVTPNAKGNVIATIATSGSYQNGFDGSHVFNFVSKGVAKSYAYATPSLGVYVPWTVDAAVYMTPTPYSQWSMVFDPDGGDASKATKLRVNLTVVYLDKAA